MNADGYPDLMHIVNNTLTVHKGDSGGISSARYTVQMALRKYMANSNISLLDYDQDDNTFTSSDFNGDGRADFIVQVRESSTNTSPPCDWTCFDPRSVAPPNDNNVSLLSQHTNDDRYQSDGPVSDTFIGLKPAPAPIGAPNEYSQSAILATHPDMLTTSDVSLATGAYMPSSEGLTDDEYSQLLLSLDINTENEKGDTASTTTTNTWRIVLSEPGSNNGFKLTEYTKLWNTTSIDKVQPMNINGDGLTDLVYRNKSTKMWYAVINNGNGFNAAITLFTLDENYLTTLDVNADGKPEILYKSGSYLYYRTYKNGGFVNRYYGTDSADYNDLNFLDMDGDGVQDRFVFQGRSRTDFRADTGANRITRVTDGFGASVSVTYDTLNNSAVYTKKNDGNAQRWGNNSRVTDIKGPIQVVSSLRKGGDVLRYKYVGGKAQIGRGMLGYKQVIITSQAASLRTTTTYRQDGIYRGSPSEVLVEAILGAGNTSPGPGPGPGDPCDIDPTICQPCPPGSDPCNQIQAVPQPALQVTTQSMYSPTNSTSATYKKKSHTAYQYAVNTDTNFRIGSLTSAQLVYPHKTTNKQFNIDSTANEVMTTKVKTVSLDSFGQPLVETTTHKDMYLETAVTVTNTYGTSVFGGRLTSARQSATRTNIVNGRRYTETPITLVSTHTYDSLGRLRTSRADNGVLTTYVINQFGLIERQTTSSSGLASRVVYTGFDSLGRHVVRKSNELGHQTTMAYNNKGFKEYSASPNGQRTYYGYNAMGRQINETHTPKTDISRTGAKALTSSKVQYWCRGVSHCPSSAVYFEEITQEGSPSARTYTDKWGNVVREAAQGLAAGSWIYKDVTFDAQNRKIAESVPYLSTTTSTLQTKITYDSQNRAIEITKPDGGVWKTQYAGFSTSTIAPDASSTVETKNGAGNLIYAKDANNYTAWYLYTTTGDLRQVNGPTGNQINILFDKYGNKKRIIDPNAGTTLYWYNAYHELFQQIDGNGHRVNYYFDKLGRTIREIRTRNTQVKEHDFITTYDSGSYAIGLQSSVRDSVSGHQIRQTYDAFSRVIGVYTTFPGFSYSEHKEYDNAGRLVKETDASTSAIRHVYNTQNWAYQVRDARTNTLYWQANSIDSYGNVNSDNFGNNIFRRMVFEGETGLLNTIRTSTRSGTLQNLQYEWDVKGNLEFRRDLSKGLREDFVYDKLNRVTQSRVTGGATVTTNIAYNSLGNIMSKTGVGTYVYHASKPNAVKSVRGERSNDYWYDNAGNIERDNQRRFTNNTFNKPTRITKSGYVVDFSYGVGGKRFKRVETNYSKSSQPKQTHYVGNVEFVKEPTQGHWIAKRYIGDKILITKVGTTESVRYMLTDHLGSTHVITDANGTKQQEMSFDVFGARRSATTWAREHHKIPQFTSNITLRGYTGHEQLDELSLVHMGGRIYDPILGRFLQADPFVQQPNNIQSFNRYSYVMNNPLNKTDPSGYIWTALILEGLKYIAANAASAALVNAANIMLTAYYTYAEIQLVKGILSVIDGGGTAMANFAGGFAKTYIKNGLADRLGVSSAKMLGIEGEEQSASEQLREDIEFVIDAIEGGIQASEKQGNSDTEKTNNDYAKRSSFERYLDNSWYMMKKTFTDGDEFLWQLERHALAMPTWASAPTAYYKISSYFSLKSFKVAKKVPNPGGRLGKHSTRQHVDDVATEMQDRGWRITRGGNRFAEEYLPGPGGSRKGSSFPDITATKNGRTIRINTIDTRANGITPTTREANNAARIRSQRPRDHLLLVPKP
jgi:RHS repeat-associated protein